MAVAEIILTILQVILCLGVIAVVLLQSGKSAGLSGSIAGGAETFFGKKKGLDDFLAKITVFVAIGFAATSLILVVISK
ncbi:preprotein translocase subunit SecG [Desulfoscipio gibsoniae]|uniref:Protein-export membrane protein SecG n=1 Tax=Desulfoscipio gibsoniae DSM 7213 TaxID=767817 RepID=R4KK34_9FIRM|nr:preprotein translocase subunit SecG [Desulfoscipio gibsoniae]AGL03538.1 protein translocase, SecG subunit [Desulfoscipio gibsoniae DSM 7213]